MHSHIHSGTQSKVENKLKKKQLSPSSEREQVETVVSEQRERTVWDSN